MAKWDIFWLVIATIHGLGAVHDKENHGAYIIFLISILIFAARSATHG